MFFITKYFGIFHIDIFWVPSLILKTTCTYHKNIYNNWTRPRLKRVYYFRSRRRKIFYLSMREDWSDFFSHKDLLSFQMCHDERVTLFQKNWTCCNLCSLHAFSFHCWQHCVGQNERFQKDAWVTKPKRLKALKASTIFQNSKKYEERRWK